MLGGSDEFVLREILDNTDHMADLHLDLIEITSEMQYANALKELELGIIDNNEFNRKKDIHYSTIQGIYNSREKRR